VLAGHKRYAHVTTIRSNSVTPGLLGMERVRSADAVRRAFLKEEAEDYTGWLHKHLDSYEELLSEPWILDPLADPSDGRDDQDAIRRAGASSATATCNYCAAVDGRSALASAAEVYFSRLAHNAVASHGVIASDRNLQLPDLG